MKIIRITELIDTPREVKGYGFSSIRALLAGDNMGFSLHKTIIPKGGPYHWHYKYHVEACYCTKGKGVLTDLRTNVQHYITPDVVYVLNNHDDHTFEALEDTVLISVFNPPVTGQEVHAEDGSYQVNPLHNRDMAETLYAAVEASSNKYDAIETITTILNANRTSIYALPRMGGLY